MECRSLRPVRHCGRRFRSRERKVMTDRYKKPILIVVGLVILWATFFTVRETEFVLVTQFGRPVRTVNTAGLHVKWPFQNARYFDRRLRVYNPRPSEFLTRDKKNLVIENYVCWQIENPEIFVKKVITEANAEARLHDVI